MGSEKIAEVMMYAFYPLWSYETSQPYLFLGPKQHLSHKTIQWLLPGGPIQGTKKCTRYKLNPSVLQPRAPTRATDGQ